MHCRTVLVALAVLASACAGDDGTDSRPDSTSTPVTTTTSTEPTLTTTIPPPPTTPPVTTPPVTTPPATTPPTSSVVSTEPVVLGAPAPELLAAAAPGSIDWDSVGPGWLFVDHPNAGPYTDPSTLDRRGLYLVSPDDVVAGVSALPTDGSRVAAVSRGGWLALLELYDPVCADGCSCPGGTPVTVETDRPEDDSGLQMQLFGYALLDLRTTEWRPIIDPVALPVCAPEALHREADFTADGTGIWVTEVWSTGWEPTSVRLARVDIATGSWVTLLDEPVEDDPSVGSPGIAVVELDDGRIAVSTPAGTSLRAPDGGLLLDLDAPDSCTLVRPWDTGHVLARCLVPGGAYPTPPAVPEESCRTSGLWLVAVDGSAARVLAVPVDETGYLSCWSGYTDARPLDDWLAVVVGGDGCSDGVVLISPEGEVETWMPPDIPDSCTEYLVGVRDGAWLLGATSEFDDRGVYEVTPDGSTPMGLPDGVVIAL